MRAIFAISGALLLSCITHAGDSEIQAVPSYEELSKWKSTQKFLVAAAMDLPESGLLSLEQCTLNLGERVIARSCGFVVADDADVEARGPLLDFATSGPVAGRGLKYATRVAERPARRIGTLGAFSPLSTGPRLLVGRGLSLRRVESEGIEVTATSAMHLLGDEGSVLKLSRTSGERCPAIRVNDTGSVVLLFMVPIGTSGTPSLRYRKQLLSQVELPEVLRPLPRDTIRPLDSTASSSRLPPNWPRFSGQLQGGRWTVEIRNSGSVDALVGLRQGRNGVDVHIPAGGSRTLWMRPGDYRVFALFGRNDPKVLRSSAGLIIRPSHKHFLNLKASNGNGTWIPL